MIVSKRTQVADFTATANLELRTKFVLCAFEAEKLVVEGVNGCTNCLVEAGRDR